MYTRQINHDQYYRGKRSLLSLFCGGSGWFVELPKSGHLNIKSYFKDNAQISEPLWAMFIEIEDHLSIFHLMEFPFAIFIQILKKCKYSALDEFVGAGALDD